MHIPDIPIQRWVNIIMTVESSIIDMYLDGKLYKHCQFKGPVAKPPEDTNMVIFGGSLFSGRISKLEYIRKFITPQRAWDIYVDGPRDSSLMSWLNRYMLRIQWLKDGHVDREYKIQAAGAETTKGMTTCSRLRVAAAKDATNIGNKKLYIL